MSQPQAPTAVLAGGHGPSGRLQSASVLVHLPLTIFWVSSVPQLVRVHAPQCVKLPLLLVDWDGGMVLVSHDFRLIGQVAKEIWEVKNGVHRWEGDIQSFKQHLKKTHDALRD